MNTFPIQFEIFIAILAGTFFAAGWVLQRWLRSRTERRTIEQLTDEVTHLRQQCDDAHCVALDMAATNARLMGEHQEAQWMIQSLESDNRLREAKIEKHSEDDESRFPATNEDFWSADCGT